MIDGIINIYKEKGYTSHDVVAKLRGILKQKKIGHTGTLDPDAEGVLPVCLGKATRLCEFLTDKVKTYETVMRLGLSTDTQDISGTVLKERDVTVSEQQLREIVSSMLGDSMQIPPMFSAIKVNGKKLYELAREGVEIERKPRPITVYELEILSIEFPYVSMRITCSKGTYIRTICHDIGEKVGCGACMAKLTRTKVSCFDIKDSVTLARVEELRDNGTLPDYVVSVEKMLEEYPAVKALPAGDKLLHNGNSIFTSQIAMKHVTGKKDMRVRMYDSTGLFIGIYYFENDRRLKPFKMFLS